MEIDEDDDGTPQQQQQQPRQQQQRQEEEEQERPTSLRRVEDESDVHERDPLLQALNEARSITRARNEQKKRLPAELIRTFQRCEKSLMELDSYRANDPSMSVEQLLGYVRAMHEKWCWPNIMPHDQVLYSFFALGVNIDKPLTTEAARISKVCAHKEEARLIHLINRLLRQSQIFENTSSAIDVPENRNSHEKKEVRRQINEIARSLRLSTHQVWCTCQMAYFNNSVVNPVITHDICVDFIFNNTDEDQVDLKTGMKQILMNISFHGYRYHDGSLWKEEVVEVEDPLRPGLQKQVGTCVWKRGTTVEQMAVAETTHMMSAIFAMPSGHWVRSEVRKAIEDVPDNPYAPHLVFTPWLRAFTNGVFDLKQCKFIPWHELQSTGSLAVTRKFDVEFEASWLTDDIDTLHSKLAMSKILAHQGYTMENQKAWWFWRQMARTQFPPGVMDDDETLLYVVGVAGSGKSVTTDIAMKWHDPSRVFVLGENMSETFGLERLPNKSLLVLREMNGKVVPFGSMFLSIATGEVISVERRNKPQMQFRPECAMIACSNQIWCMRDSGGNWARRVVWVPFNEPVRKSDAGLKMSALSEYETGLAMVMSNRIYHATARMMQEDGVTNFWNAIHGDFLKTRQIMSGETNSITAFMRNTDLLRLAPGQLRGLEDEDNMDGVPDEVAAEGVVNEQAADTMRAITAGMKKENYYALLKDVADLYNTKFKPTAGAGTLAWKESTFGAVFLQLGLTVKWSNQIWPPGSGEVKYSKFVFGVELAENRTSVEAMNSVKRRAIGRAPQQQAASAPPLPSSATTSGMPQQAAPAGGGEVEEEVVVLEGERVEEQEQQQQQQKEPPPPRKPRKLRVSVSNSSKNQRKRPREEEDDDDGGEENDGEGYDE